MFIDTPIPQDVYDLVIDALRDDKFSLEACSLVASAWRAASQKLLYRAIVLRTSQSSPRPFSDGRRNSLSSIPYRENRTLFLLDMPARLLQCVRTFIIRGDRGRYRDEYEGPDPFLADFLGKISTQMFPSLTGVELRDLEWTCTRPSLRRALITLVSRRYIKGVSLVDCRIPFDVQWLRFVGPETRSLRLEGILPAMTDHDTSIDNIPILAASNLISLDLGEVKTREISRWILRSSKTPRNAGEPSDSVLRSLQSITTLSLQCYEGFLELVQACSGLESLKLTLLGYTLVPLDLIMRIPTLEYLHVSALSPEELPWIISTLKTVYFSPASLHHISSAAVTKNMSIFLELSGTFIVSTPERHPFTLTLILDQLRDLDDMVAILRNVEVSLKMAVATFDPADSRQSYKHEGTMVTLLWLRAHLKALEFHPRWIS
ncbi:hypothetical protein ONZ45_g7192 [Pleurotus djamor]|nr:hypothetical protein ONZ45_g7192 [Pleurotus djamor]